MEYDHNDFPAIVNTLWSVELPLYMHNNRKVIDFLPVEITITIERIAVPEGSSC